MMKKPTIKDLTEFKYTEEELEQWVSEFDKDELAWMCYKQTLSESFLEKNDVKCWGVVLEHQRYSAQLLIQLDMFGFEKLEQVTSYDGSMSTSQKIDFALGIIKDNNKMTEEEKQEIIDTLILVHKLTV